MKDIKIQLYKEDGKGVEGFLTITETSDFPITKALADIQDISKRKSTTSKSIKVGGTKENNLLLGNIYDVDTIALTFDINKIQKCAVLIDGELFLNNCILQLTDITKVQHNSAYESDIEYTVNIKSNNADFFSTIKNKELTDLTFGENELSINNFIFKAENVVSTFNNDYTDGFKYVLPHFTTNTPHQIPVNTFRPAIYLRTYFDKIVKDANFRYTFDEIQGSDNILHFNKILIPFLNKAGDKKTNLDIFNVRADSTYTANTVRDYNNTSVGRAITGKTPNADVNYDVIIQDESGSWDGSEYIPQFNGNLNIKTKATITAKVNNMNTLNALINNRFSAPGVPLTPDGTVIGYFKVFYVINRNGVDIPNTTSFIGGIPIEAGTIVNSMDSVTIGTIDGEVLSTVNVLANDVIKMKVYGQLDSIPTQTGIYTSNSVIPLNQLDTTTPIIDVNYEIKVENNEIVFESNLQEVSQNFGSFIDINNFIPKKIKQGDFIKSVLNMFNLYVIPDENDDNLLHFKTRDKFFDDGVSYDWTDYLVKDKEQLLTKLSQNQKKKKLFTYKADKNPENVSYTAETNEIYGQATFNFDDENIYEEDKLELIFSPSPYLKHTEDNMYLTDMPEDSGLRILYDGGLRDCVTTLLFDYSSNGVNYGEYINQYPLAIHFNDEQNPTFDLNFSVCPMYNTKPDVLTNNNLFNNYWRRTMHQLNSGYLYTAYFNLDENIVSSLKLNERIYVDGKWYNINQITDYNPAKSKIVKVELITVDDGASTYKGIVVDNSKPGIVRPSKNPGVVDTFLDNNVVIANPGRPNKGVGTGNIIVGFDNNIKGNDNIIVADGANVTGNNNEVKSAGIVSGDNNTIEEGLNNVIVMGDNLTVTESNTIAVENLQVDNINGAPIPVGGIPSEFIDLDDTPKDYTGQAGKVVTVNSTEDGLEFTTGGSTLTGSTSIDIVSNEIQRAALTGDVTSPANSNVTTIANGAVTSLKIAPNAVTQTQLGPISVTTTKIVNNNVTNEKLADMPTMTIKGNDTVSTADPKDLTVAEVKAMLESTPPVDITQANLQTECNNGTVVPGQLYRLTDQENIIFKGITSTTVESQYVIIKAVKDEHYTEQLSGNVKGVLRKGDTYTAGNIVIWGGRCWTKGAGTQTATNLPSEDLDANVGGTITNWTMIADSNNTYYQDMLIKVDADIQMNLYYGKYTGGNNNTFGGYLGLTLLSILRSDWGNRNIYNNNCYYILNNSNRQSGGATTNINNNSNNGGIYNNSNNAGILHNTNGGDISSNSNNGAIFNNSNNGAIFNNSNNGGIYNNTNNGQITFNSNNGQITFNSNNGHIFSNSNNGGILSNSNSGYIFSNSNYGNINNNSNNGIIEKNYQHTSYPTTEAHISYNSNLGNIGGLSTGLGNRMRSSISYNSNGSSIYSNTNDGTGTIYVNGNSMTVQIGMNGNASDIRNNTGVGMAIYNNFCNGWIISNSNRGSIYNNRNNGNIDNNKSNSTSYNNNHISNNLNNGVIAVTFNANNVACYRNTNNGAIVKTTTTNIFDTINDKF